MGLLWENRTDPTDGSRVRQLQISRGRKQVRDQVIAAYLGLSGVDVEKGVTAMKASAPAHLKTFLLRGPDHVVYDVPSVTTPAGMSAGAWSEAFAGDAKEWDHSGP